MNYQYAPICIIGLIIIVGLFSFTMDCVYSQEDVEVYETNDDTNNEVDTTDVMNELDMNFVLDDNSFYSEELDSLT